MNEILQRQQYQGILRLTLNDPLTRNSLSDAMLAALAIALDEARQNDQVRVVVIAAEGPAFCSGHNLKEITAHRQDEDQGKAYFSRLMAHCSALMQAIVHHPKPVIAEVQAVASAAGCQLVASCDLALASEQARFATPGVNIGLFCSTPMVALSRAVGRKPAMEMLLTGDLVDAQTAKAIGLVNRVVPPAERGAATLALAQLIAAKSALTVAIGKEAFYRQAELGLSDAYSYAAQIMTRNMLAADAAEGIDAFLEKRPPLWQDA